MNPTQTILTDLLALAVPLEIERFRTHSSVQRWRFLQGMGHASDNLGECLYFTGKDYTGKRTREQFSWLARALALMSFLPGGSRMFGLSWDSSEGRDDMLQQDPSITHQFDAIKFRAELQAEASQ